MCLVAVSHKNGALENPFYATVSFQSNLTEKRCPPRQNGLLNKVDVSWICLKFLFKRELLTTIGFQFCPSKMCLFHCILCTYITTTNYYVDHPLYGQEPIKFSQVWRNQYKPIWCSTTMPIWTQYSPNHVKCSRPLCSLPGLQGHRPKAHFYFTFWNSTTLFFMKFLWDQPVLRYSTHGSQKSRRNQKNREKIDFQAQFWSASNQ